MCSMFGCIIALICLASLEIVTSCDVGISKMNGTLGKPFYLNSSTSEPRSNIILKKFKSTTKKEKVLQYDFKSTSVCSSRYCFDESKNTIIFVKLQKDDEGTYELINESGTLEDTCQFHINVYEQITNVSIHQTTHSHNDTCVVSLKCRTQTENVTFAWNRGEEDLHHNSSILRISIKPDDAESSYTCKVKNPVSEDSTTVMPFKECVLPPAQSWTTRNIAVVSVVVVVLMVLGFVLYKVVLQRHKKTGEFAVTVPERPPVPAPQTPTVETIYATVDKKPPEKLSSATVTIYELAGHSGSNV